MSREDSYFRLRLPEPEKQFIRQESVRNCRSMTAEIIMIIRQRMAETEKTKTETAGKALQG